MYKKEEDIRRHLLERFIRNKIASTMDVGIDELKGIFNLATIIHAHFRANNDTRNLKDFLAAMELVILIFNSDYSRGAHKPYSDKEVAYFIQLLELKISSFQSFELGPDFVVKILQSLNVELLKKMKNTSESEDGNSPTGYGSPPGTSSVNVSVSTDSSLDNEGDEPAEVSPPDPFELDSTGGSDVSLPTPSSSVEIVDPAPSLDSFESYNPSVSSKSPITGTPFDISKERPKGFAPYGDDSSSD